MRRFLTLMPLFASNAAFAKAVNVQSTPIKAFLEQNAASLVIAASVIAVILLCMDSISRKIDNRMRAIESRQVYMRKEMLDFIVAQLRLLASTNEVNRKQMVEQISSKTIAEVEKMMSGTELSQKVNDLFHEVKSVSINQEGFQDNIIRLCEYLKTKEEAVFKEVEETNARLRRKLGKVG